LVFTHWVSVANLRKSAPVLNNLAVALGELRFLGSLLANHWDNATPITAIAGHIKTAMGELAQAFRRCLTSMLGAPSLTALYFYFLSGFRLRPLGA
jgi:hypothetical protein